MHFIIKAAICFGIRQQLFFDFRICFFFIVTLLFIDDKSYGCIIAPGIHRRQGLNQGKNKEKYQGGFFHRVQR